MPVAVLMFNIQLRQLLDYNVKNKNIFTALYWIANVCICNLSLHYLVNMWQLFEL